MPYEDANMLTFFQGKLTRMNFETILERRDLSKTILKNLKYQVSTMMANLSIIIYNF